MQWHPPKNNEFSTRPAHRHPGPNNPRVTDLHAPGSVLPPFAIALAAVALSGLVAVSPAAARPEYAWGGKLDLTRGVTTVDGAAGGGIASWALIAGNETRDGIGGVASATAVRTHNYTLTSYAVGLGAWDRYEISLGGQDFDTGKTGGRLGLGNGYTFHQDILGLKARLFGDAVYDQDRWMPQVAVGLQLKSADHKALLHALGARRAEGVDYYVSATKILLDKSLLLDATLRLTEANQWGLLGFGGDRRSGSQAQFEGSIGYLVTPKLLVGAEVRTKPDNLRFAREGDAADLFAALALSKTLSATLAWAEIGDVATFRRQSGLYLSLQAGF
jgi:hypothetical protein